MPAFPFPTRGFFMLPFLLLVNFFLISPFLSCFPFSCLPTLLVKIIISFPQVGVPAFPPCGVYAVTHVVGWSPGFFLALSVRRKGYFPHSPYRGLLSDVEPFNSRAFRPPDTTQRTFLVLRVFPLSPPLGGTTQPLTGRRADSFRLPPPRIIEFFFPWDRRYREMIISFAPSYPSSLLVVSFSLR